MTESDKDKSTAQSGSGKPEGGKPGTKATGPGKKTPAGSGQDKPRRESRLPLLVALLALLVAIAAGMGATAVWYLGEQRLVKLSERMDTVERGLESNVQDVVLPRLRKLDERLQGLAQSNDGQSAKLNTLRQGLTETQATTAELADLVEGGRRRWKLLEIEDLMLVANERLRLYHDPAGARQVLRLVNQRLGKLNDPRLFDVRELVVDEIAALNALPDPDIQGLALSLSALIDQVPQWSLSSDVPSDYAGGLAEEEAFRLPEQPWRHFMDSLREALEGMVTLKRTDADHQPLMPPKQEFFLYQNLLLKLQTARLALLDRNAQIYRDSLSAAQQWLTTFFDADDPAVAAAQEELRQLSQVQLQWDVPDISGSVTALRRFLRQQGGQAAASASDEETTDGGE